MSFPSSRRVVYHNNPLVEVICQLRFPPILEIAAHEPAEFQNRIRDLYPLYEAESPTAQLPKDIANVISQLGVPVQAEQTVHKFLASDSSRFISLARDFVAVSFSDYLRWEEFSQQLELARMALEDIYHPAFYSRVGLRYRDIIDKGRLGLTEETWDVLFKSWLIGMLAAPEVQDSIASTQTTTIIQLQEVSGGMVTLRHGLARPSPDEPVVYAIDADFYTEERRGPRDVTGVLDQFNRLAGYFFRWAITAGLHDALKPEDIE